MVIEGPPKPDSAARSDMNSEALADKVAMSFATAPRGGLSTILKVSPSSGAWLRQHNPFLRDITFPPAGKVKVLVCENGECREEGLVEAMGTLGLGEGEAEAVADSGAGDEAEAQPAETAEAVEVAVAAAA